MWSSTWQTAAVLFTLPLLPYADEWKLFVSRGTNNLVLCDAQGARNLGSAGVYSTHDYTSPTAVVGGAHNVAEWLNLAMVGKRFAHVSSKDSNVVIPYYSETGANVTVRANRAVVAETTVLAGGSSISAIAGTGLAELEIESSTDLSVGVATGPEGFAPLPPVAKTIYGNCAEGCSISIWGGNTSIPIERTCTDGSSVEVQAGSYTGTSDYGQSCKWTAPDGYAISGATTRNLPGAGLKSDEVSAFMPAEYFYPTVPLPAKFSILILISTGPAVCQYDNITVNLAGASGVYHARLTALGSGLVITCDMPVVAMGDAHHKLSDDITAAMTLVVAPMATTTTTSTTSTGTRTTNTTTTTTTSSLSSSATTSATTTTTHSTTTVTTTTSTTSTATTSSSSSPTTTTSVTTSTSMTETSTTTTATATRSTTTMTMTTTSTPTTTTRTTTTPTATTSITSIMITSTTSTIMLPTATASTTTTTMSTPTMTATSRTSSMTSSTTRTTTNSATTATMSTTTNSTSMVTSVTLSATTMSSIVTASTTSANEPTAAELLNRVETLEASLLPSFLAEGNLTTVVQGVDALTLVAARLDAAAVAATGGSLTVPLKDSEAAVTVSASLFPSLGLGAQGMVLTIAKADIVIEGFIATVISVNLLSPAGRHLNVSGLVDPIKVVIPVNDTSGLQCVFWDVDSSTWATTGVYLGAVGEGTVECWTTHLTLFAAIVRGFVKTLACSQVSLLNAESIKELGKPGWHSTFGALVFWSLLAAFMLLLLLAAWIDQRRWRQGKSTAEHLLIPMRDGAEDAGQEEQPQEENGGEASTERRGICACAAGCSCGLVEWCRSSGVLRDVADEVFSQWAEHFGEIRDLVEGLVEGLDLCGAPTAGRIALFVHRLLTKTLIMSAQRQVAASLGISWDISELVMTDEQVNEVVTAHHARPTSQGLQRGISTTTLAREEAWGQLHRDIEVKLDTVMPALAQWSSLPGTVWHLFLHQNPFSMCLVHCAFTSCKLRVLLFVTDVLGSLMLATVFFAAAGARQKGTHGPQCDTEDDTFEFIGRTLAVGTGSLLFAGIPATILGSLCTRAPKKFDFEGCPKWNRQLAVWRIQDRAIWVLGSSYLACCVFFISLFLANVDEKDHGDWLMSGLLSIVECTVLIPLAIALILPLLVTTCLHITSLHRRVAKEELVSELHLQFKRDVNMAVTVGTI